MASRCSAPRGIDNLHGAGRRGIIRMTSPRPHSEQSDYLPSELLAEAHVTCVVHCLSGNCPRRSVDKVDVSPQNDSGPGSIR